MLLLLSCTGGEVGESGDDLRLTAADLIGRDQTMFVGFQEQVRLCMRSKGFDYEPQSAIESGFSFPVEVFDLEPAEFVDQYGWGFSTLQDAPMAPGASDPNAAVIRALTPGERSTWHEAVQVCLNSGDLSDPAVVALRRDREILRNAYAYVESDQRVVTEYQRWSRCLSVAGYPDYATPDDVKSDIVERITEVFEIMEDRYSPPDRAQVDITLEPEFVAIVDYERGLAITSLACDFGPPLLGMNSIVRTVLNESLDRAEREFDG